MRRGILRTDSDVAIAFLQCIELGMTVQASCDYAGIHTGTFFLWQRRAEEDQNAGKTSRNSPYISFMNEYRKAKAKCMSNNLGIIRKASEKGSWQASAWLLERRFPNDFALKNQQADLSENKIVVVNDIPEKSGEDNGED